MRVSISFLILLSKGFMAEIDHGVSPIEGNYPMFFGNLDDK